MLKNLILISLLALILFACAGKDVLDTDKTPPNKPHLIKHLGDTGVTYNQVPGQLDNYFNAQGVEENGADAVDVQDNAIQIMWEVLTDTDIDYLEVWRFNLTEPDTLLINTLHNYNQNYYVDNFPHYEVNPTGEDWFYFLKVYDTSGNYAVSDTACYRLLSKPIIVSPQNNIQVADFAQIDFSWYVSPGNIFNLLIFDENYNLLKSYSALDEPSNTYQVSFNDLNIPNEILQNKTKLYWEIVMTGTSVIREINGVNYTVYSGSESERYTITKTK